MSPRAADPRVALPSRERLRINEIFYSLQGESTHVGRPCVLVRLTGCQMRCSWCDSEHSFYEGSWMTLGEILDEVARFGCPLVEVTGGEPLLQPAVHPLLSALCDAGYEVLLETGGGISIEGVDPRVARILDVKCPGSGEHEANRWQNLADLRPGDEVKFVLADEDDFHWAAAILREHRLDEVCPVHFSPVAGSLPAERLAGWILERRLPVRLATQLHKALWGAETRGV